MSDIRRPRTGGIDRLFLVAAAVTLLPMLASIPGMADLPNHIARHAVLADDGAGPLARWWTIGWKWTGNLGVDLPVMALAPLFGPELATRIVVATIAPLTVLGIWRLGHAVHGRATAGAALALPFALAQPYLYGFVNFCLSVALALLVAAWWLRARGGAARVAFGLLLSLLVFTAHIMGWAVLLLIVGGIELSRLRDPADLGQVARRNWPLLAPLVPLLLWRGAAAGPLYTWTPHVLASKAMIVATVLKGLSKPFDLAMTALLFLVIAVAWVRRWIDPGLAVAAVLLAVAALALPTMVLGSWGADLRLMPYAPMLALLAIRPLPNRRAEAILLIVGFALLIARVGVATVLWWQDSAAFERRLALLERVPSGSRMGFLVVEPCGTPWRLSPDRKLGSYAVVRRAAFTNTLFQIPGADLITMRAPQDRARWFDGSQDIDGCDETTLGTRVNQQVAAMAADRFATIWLVDAPVIAPPSGATVAHPSARDTLIVSRRD